MQTRDAPAKINLALHVTGRRADGYHLIESFVVFTELGDRVSARVADHDGFALEGPEAAALSIEDAAGNLVVRARESLRAAARSAGRVPGPVHITLDKRLPVASGIGGGSADAAATLRLLCDLWDFRPAPEDLSRIALGLGADVPMCLNGQPLIARGIGETLNLRTRFSLDLVNRNPRIGVRRPRLQGARESGENAPSLRRNALAQETTFRTCFQASRNDLEPPAAGFAPFRSGLSFALNRLGRCFCAHVGIGRELLSGCIKSRETP